MIIEKIRDYLRHDPFWGGAHGVTRTTMQCFVGMIETGEATLDDFTAAGGSVLRSDVESELCREATQ